MTLHITNGDCTADTLRLIVSDPVITTCDVLHEGACPPADGEPWYDARARFLSDGFGSAYADTKAGLAETDRTIIDAVSRRAKAPAERPDIVLWFEHDLFDQLLLIRTLDLLVRLQPDTADTHAAASTDTHGGDPVVPGVSRTLPRVSLICLDRFPGVNRFIGLGELAAEQLATLKGTAVPVIAGHYALAEQAWRAFRSPDPTELLDLARQLDAARVASSEGGPVLPFLGDALLRFLAEYPSVHNGLSRTEELAIQALLAGPVTAGALFGATQAREPLPFLGDSSFFDMLQRLAQAQVPIVTIAVDAKTPGRRHQVIAITEAGRDIAANRGDHVRLNGIDLWRGGVHLIGSDRSPWRWDGDAETLVS